MLNIPKLDFYDTAAVKAFVLDVLVENQQLKTVADSAESRADAWFQDYLKQKERAEAAEAKVADLESTADSLAVATERDAALEQKGGAGL